MANKKRIEPTVKTFKLSKLNPSPYNPRKISKDAMDGLTASLAKFGCVEPIIVNIRSGLNVIVGGHQRYKVLKRLHGIDAEIIGIAVNLTKKDERTLNLTLNNRKLQGEFIADLEPYIEQLLKDLADDQAALDLKITALRKEIQTQSRGMSYIEEPIRPFKKIHILLSLPPALLPKIHNHLTAIIRIEGVEYVQGQN